jgi:hypothetical protein
LFEVEDIRGSVNALAVFALCRRFFAASFSILGVDEEAMVDVFYGASLLHPCRSLPS